MLNNRQVVVGPRGGRQELSTPCSTCVAYPLQLKGRCYVSGRFAAWGCEDWVDAAGRRVARGVVEDVDRLDLEPEEPAPAAVVAAGFDPEGSGPVLVAYVDPPAPFVPAGLGEGQGVLPMPDAGPLFAAPDKAPDLGPLGPLPHFPAGLGSYGERKAARMRAAKAAKRGRS